MTEAAPSAALGRYAPQLAALSLAMLVPSLGTSIANVALPSLETAFGATFPQVQWIVLAYLLAVTALIVVAGRLGDVLGRRPVLLTGIGLFTVASALGMVAPNLPSLIVVRGLQGIGAAAMMALTVAVVGDTIPRERSGTAMGWLGTVSAIGTALGPLVGGLLISWLGWRSLFGVMTMVGVLAFCAGYLTLPVVERQRRSAGLDWFGTLLLATALAAYALVTTIGTATSLVVTIVLATLAAVAFGGFLVVQTRARAPLVQLAVLRDPAIRVSLLAMAIVSAIVMTTLVVGPFYLSGTLDLSDGATGLTMSVGPIVAALVGAPAGSLVDRAGATRVSLAGLAGVTLGAILMVALPHAFSVLGYALALATITAGYGLFQAATTTAAMSAVAPDQRGVMSALFGLSRNLGLITGASVMGAVFASASRIGLGPLPVGGETGLVVVFAIAAIASIATSLLVARWRTVSQ